MSVALTYTDTLSFTVGVHIFLHPLALFAVRLVVEPFEPTALACIAIMLVDHVPSDIDIIEDLCQPRTPHVPESGELVMMVVFPAFSSVESKTPFRPGRTRLSKQM